MCQCTGVHTLDQRSSTGLDIVAVWKASLSLVFLSCVQQTYAADADLFRFLFLSVSTLRSFPLPSALFVCVLLCFSFFSRPCSRCVDFLGVSLSYSLLSSFASSFFLPSSSQSLSMVRHLTSFHSFFLSSSVGSPACTSAMQWLRGRISDRRSE